MSELMLFGSYDYLFYVSVYFLVGIVPIVILLKIEKSLNVFPATFRENQKNKIINYRLFVGYAIIFWPVFILFAAIVYIYFKLCMPGRRSQ